MDDAFKAATDALVRHRKRVEELEKQGMTHEEAESKSKAEVLASFFDPLKPH